MKKLHERIFTFLKGSLSLYTKTVWAFLVSFLLCFLVVGFIMENKIEHEKSLMEQMILEQNVKINDRLSGLFYKTNILSAMIIQNGGKIGNFEQIAAAISDDESIVNIIIAPDGIVSHVYPLEGNEAVIGLDLFSEGKGNQEAIIAKETGKLVMGGPFELTQGGQGLVGTLPVMMETKDGESDFWGLVSVTLEFPQVLDGLRLRALENQGMAYKILRVNPESLQTQTIVSSIKSFDNSVDFVEKKINVQNTEWIFRIYPVHEWNQYTEFWVMIVFALCISILFTVLIQSNGRFKKLQSRLEVMARTDQLTGVYNRHSFLEIASAQFEKSQKSKSSCFVVMIDLDHFKLINDTYGHHAGDEVLKETAKRIQEMVRDCDVFARYGGEEFIIFVPDLAESHVKILAERMRAKLSYGTIKFEDTSIQITASFGVTSTEKVADLQEAINFADDAMYKAKTTGRNRVVFYNKVK